MCQQFCGMSRVQLRSVVKMEKQINCLKTDLIAFKILSNCYEKYFDFFDQISETIDSNKQFLDVKQKIKVLKELNLKPCCVSLNKLKDLDLKHPKELTEVFTQTEFDENAKQFITEEVSDNDSDGIECDINLSNDETIDGSVDENNEQNEETNESTNNSNNNNLNEKRDKSEETPKRSQTEVNPEFILNTRLRNRSESKRKLKSMSRQSEGTDSDIESDYNSETEIDSNAEQSSDNSDEEFNGSELKPKTKKRLRTQTLDKSGNSYVCEYPECEAVFTALSALKSHKFHTHSVKYECDVEECNYYGLKEEALRRHKYNRHSIGNPVPYVCQHIDCGKEFKLIESLKNHETIHSREKPFKCNWNDCSESFALKKQYIHHLNRHKKTYRCDYESCGYVGALPSHLKVHKYRVHSRNQFKCSINGCEQVFKIEKSLEHHNLSAHPLEFNDIPWIECKEKDCNYKTKAKLCFCKHMNAHKERKAGPFVCTVCQKSFALKNRLLYHSRRHRNIESKLKCSWPECGRVFISNLLLKWHTNVHTAEIKHSCLWPGCNQTFLNKHSLNIHVARHKGKCRYKCPHNDCDYGSTNNIRYKNHLKTHENQSKESVE